MDVFDLRRKLVSDYATYVRSFIQIADPRIQHHVQDELERGALWPDPLIQLNPAFEPGLSSVARFQIQPEGNDGGIR